MKLQKTIVTVHIFAALFYAKMLSLYTSTVLEQLAFNAHAFSFQKRLKSHVPPYTQLIHMKHCANSRHCKK